MPIKLQALRKGDRASMLASLNRRLMKFNPRLLPVRLSRGHDQPMVDSMARRLKELKDREGLSHDSFGEIAGVSAQSVSKWLKGGDVEERNLAKIAKYFKVEPAWIRYGITAALDGNDLPHLARGVAERWAELSAERQEWFRDLIFTVHWMERRFPVMKKGRPRGESYGAWEAAMDREVRQLKLKLE